jgi:O-6-methylguanine DNA methyltransferase
MKTRRKLRAGALVAEVELDGNALQSVKLPKRIPDGIEAADLAEMIRQLAEFDIDLSDAPPFTGRAWKRMMRIPKGSALTYSELAAAAGSPRAIRAAGQACATNRRLLVIPCHRVVAAEGLGGFALGLEWKRKLLELESEG